MGPSTLERDTHDLKADSLRMIRGVEAAMTALYRLKEQELRAHALMSPAEVRRCVKDGYRACVEDFEKRALDIAIDSPDPRGVKDFALRLRDDFAAELRGRDGPAERLKNVRMRLGLTLEDVAERCSFSAGSISNFENGRRELNPSASRRLGNALEVPPDFLLANSERADVVDIS